MKKEQILFRCSSLGDIMTNSRGKSNLEKYNDAVTKLKKYQADYAGMTNKETKTAEKKKIQVEKTHAIMREFEEIKDEVTLSATCKKRLRTMMIEHKFNRKKRVDSKYLTKGIECEESAITLYSKFMHKNYKNNTERLSNEYLTGEIDLKDLNDFEDIERVIDIKNRFDIDTFFDREDEENQKNDFWQLTGYMAINTTAESATIANCLVNNTRDAIGLELRKEGFKWNEGIVPEDRQLEIIADNVFDVDTFEEIVETYVGRIETELGVEAYNNFVAIPWEERVIEVTQDRDEEAIAKIYERVDQCRKYMADKWGI